MDPAILESLFRKALNSCKFFPKVSEILEPLQAVKKAALPEEASEAWQKVLSIRREHFNPDLPRYLDRALTGLPERVQRAARAAGVFQEVSDPDQLHIWAKKRFIESYLAWEEIEEGQFLLPEGELKNLLAGFAATKAMPARVAPLPDSIPYMPEIVARRVSMSTEPSAEDPTKVAAPMREAPPVIDFEGRFAELARQKEIIQQKYPATGREVRP
jgi:hypothetical protein